MTTLTFPQSLLVPRPMLHTHNDQHQHQPEIVHRVVVISPPDDPSSKEFAYELLEAELRLAAGDNISKQFIARVFELHRVAIEYYNHRKSKREVYFEKKLEALSSNPVVLGALHESQPTTDTFYKKKQIERLMEINQKETLSAKQMLQSVFQVEKKVQSSLRGQVDSIQRRLNQRKLHKKSFQGDSLLDINDIPVTNRKKLNKTMIALSSTQDENQSKYFVNGVVQADTGE